MGREVGRIGVEHIIPPRVLEVPGIVPEVAVVGYADKRPELQLVNSGLFLNLAQGGYGNVLTGLLVAFRQVPQASAVDQQKVAPPVGYQSAGRIDFAEFRAQALVGAVHIRGGDVDSGNGVRSLEHLHKGADVNSSSHVKLHRVRVGKPFVGRTAYDYASFLEVYPVHKKITIFAPLKGQI